jgi:FtsP/CotA-like multicopper oxidase with cupredoxin domain
MKKNKFNPKITRRQVLKAGMIGGAGMMLPLRFLPAKAFANPAATGLSDPAVQPKFVEYAPNALDPGFLHMPLSKGAKAGIYNLRVAETVQQTGLCRNGTGPKLNTTVWGYGDDNFVSWPGRTLEVESSLTGNGLDTTKFTTVRWENELGNHHLLPVDTNWAYSLPGYEMYTIKKNGVPIVTHLHGGHSDFQFDGNPEFFWSPDYEIVGPQWAPLGGIIKEFVYQNDQPAGNLWYHDHALGITRLNVYAGMAGFYFVRDTDDTGLPGNSLKLPAVPYELAYAIQDRMFTKNGDLFYPAFPGDPFYDDFITGEGAVLPTDLFPKGGPTALAEFFGDHMVVNGKIWPKEDVEPRNYRMHLLNGTDSRFMIIQFYEVPPDATDFSTVISGPLDFDVIGSDQGLASSISTVDTLLSEPGSRYDIIFDFKTVTAGNRVIMKNIGGDEPFGGDPGPQIYSDTDKIMAFDVVKALDTNVADVFPTNTEIDFGPDVPAYGPTRAVALFEGKDEFGRLQPLLGTAEPSSVTWPATPVYQQAKIPDGTPEGISSPLGGPMEGSIAWHSPTTENPVLGTTERWEIWNVTGDAHPVHLHLVHFEVLEREGIVWDTATGDGEGEFGRVADPIGMPGSPTPDVDGTYLVVQPTVQHNSVAGDATTYGMGFKIMNKTLTGVILPQPSGYVENTPKDMVTALPDEVTRIKAEFDKLGRYVWHCHILSHEDHEMMRVLQVV